MRLGCYASLNEQQYAKDRHPTIAIDVYSATLPSRGTATKGVCDGSVI